MDFKTEEIWEEDLDPDAEPTLFFGQESVGPVCGFCDQILQNENALLMHAHLEHDISPEVFDKVDLRDAAAVQEAFLNVANMRNEFVSIGEVERCRQCGFLSTSANVFAAHKCIIAQQIKDPVTPIKPKDPLVIPRSPQNPNVLNENFSNAQQNFISHKINQVINSTAKPFLVCKIIKPLAKPQVELTVGNIIEMALVETVVNAGLKVRPPDVYNERNAVEMVYSLCQTPQKYMVERLRSIPADMCLQLLHLLRTRRVRVPAHETVTDLLKYGPEVNRSNNRLQRVPASPVLNSNLPLLQPQFIHPVAMQPQTNIVEPQLAAIQHQLAGTCKDKWRKISPRPVMSTETPASPDNKYECSDSDSSPRPLVISLEEPRSSPPRKLSRDDNRMRCGDCSRKFDSKYTFIKHMQWKSITQEHLEPLYCKFCLPEDRKFVFCEKGLKTHVDISHKWYQGRDRCYSTDGNIWDKYKCNHCKRERMFKCLAMFLRHVKTCCRKSNCTTCPEYVVKLRSPKKSKSPAVQKTPVKSKRAKNVLRVKVPNTKGKTSLLEDDAMKQEDTEDFCIRPEFAFVAVKSDPNAQMVEEEISEISHLCMKSAPVLECVSCDLQESSPSRLRSHFLKEHPKMIEEYQMSISRCGSVSARWVCPLCGNIFATEDDFLGHVRQHGVVPQDLLARVDDLRYLPTLRSALFTLKTKK